jgi:hypothetical protein
VSVRPALRALSVGVASLVLLELGALVVLRCTSPRQSPAELQARLDTADPVALPEAVGARADPRREGNVLHPYLGFVRRHNPGGVNHVMGRLVDVPVNPYGFFGPSPLEPRPEGSVRVVLTGGSVALELYLVARDTLAAELARAPALAGREIEIVSLALGGQKQPQQLMALNWFLLLGAEFDIVINLDGFNEIALPVTDILPAGIFPFYPTRWPRLALTQVDVDAATLLGRAALVRQRREAWRRAVARAPWRYSSFVLALWSAHDARLAAEVTALAETLRARLSAEDHEDVQLVGPPYEVASPEEAFPEAVAVWVRASRMMAQLAADHGIVYRQFLQPNQNVPGSKVFTPEEIRRAKAPANYRYRWAVERAWSLLEAGGRDLVADGVPFTDLTWMFVDTPERVYRDHCCHLGNHGYRLLAARIAEEVGSSLPESGSGVGAAGFRQPVR